MRHSDKKLQHNNNFINTQKQQKLLAKMKKNYTSPAIETTDILVEQGIAISNFTHEVDIFNLDEATYDEYNGGAAIW